VCMCQLHTRLSKSPMSIPLFVTQGNTVEPISK
jgi:hypothetical protein